MKPTIIATFVMLFVMTAEARKKPLTYGYTGTVRSSHVSHHEAEGSFTDSHGNTTDVYCDPDAITGGTHCGVVQGSAFYVTLDDKDPGKHEVVVFSWDPNVGRINECTSLSGSHVFDCDPLVKMAKPGEEVAFRYRRIWVQPGYVPAFKAYRGKHRDTDYGWEDFCVPFEVKDHQGQTWQSETCYRRE